MEAYDVRATDWTWTILEVVQRIADAHDVPMAQVAIAWLLTRPTVATVLLGARTADQLAQTLPAVRVERTDAEVDELTRVSAPALPAYPHGVVEEFSEVPHWHTLGIT